MTEASEERKVLSEVAEPISEIAELNDLRMKVLNGEIENISPEKYYEMLLLVRKVRRSKGEPVEKPSKPKLDIEGLLAGMGKKQ